MSADYSLTLSNELKMPLIGLGTFQNKNASDVEMALNLGYRLIDTAFIYENEEIIGEALERIFKSNSIKREDIFIISKLPNNGHNNVKYFLQKSLAALQLDYLDLYLIHSPLAAKGKQDYDSYPVENGKLIVDRDADLLKTWKSMEETVELGLTKNIGLSNFNIQQIQKIYKNCRIKPANVQVECHAYLPQLELHAFCKERNITMTAYSPLGAAFLSDLSAKYTGQRVELPIMLEEPVLKTLSQKYGKTEAQIVLRWLTQRGIYVIPKSATEEHLRENLQIFDFILSSEDKSQIEKIDKRFRYYKFDFLPGIKDHPQYPFHEDL